MKSGWQYLVIGVLIALCCVTLLLTRRAAPRYVAEASFSVNWQLMPDPSQDRKGQTLEGFRKDYIAQVGKAHFSDPFMSELYTTCEISDDRRNAFSKRLKQHLVVKLTGTTNDCDWFCVQFADDNREFALQVVNAVNTECVNRINLYSQGNHGVQAIKSYADNAEAQDTEEKLRQRQADLLKQQRDEYNPARQVQIQDTEDALNKNNMDEFKSGIEALANGLGFLANPAQIEQQGVVRP